MAENPRPLPQVAPAEAPERADAARNRERILRAAEQLFAERGVGAVTMDEIAAAAGVGKGTLYRRFGDRSGLALALLDEQTRCLQHHAIRGTAPLGPGTPPAQRLCAFLAARVDLLETYADLHVLGETGTVGARYRTGHYAFDRLHIEMLLRELHVNLDAAYLADALLAPLSAELYIHLRRDRGITAERVKAGLASIVDALASGALP